MNYFADFFQICEVIGAGWAVSIFLTGIIIAISMRLLCKRINKFDELFKRLDIAITRIEQSIHTDDGRLINRSEIADGINSLISIFQDHQVKFSHHLNDTDKIRNMEPYEHCDVNRCPNFSYIIKLIEQTRDLIKQFVAEGRVARRETQESINGIFSKFDTFLVEIIKLAVKNNDRSANN